MNTDIIARNLRMIMGLRNIWVPEMQYLSRISLNDLNNFTNGRQKPNGTQLEALARELKVEVGTLLDPNAITLNFKI